ncbi:hypothetical protein JCM15519_11600 [Fundidesulfovibrio butyratiphilus]
MASVIISERTYMQSFFREFTFVVFYHKKTVMVSAAVCFAISLLLAVLLPPIYSASAKFIVSSYSQQLDPLQQDRDYDLKNKMVRILQNQKEIIFSNPVLQKAVEKVLPNATPKQQAEFMDQLRHSVKVTPPKGESFEGSNVFYLTCEAKSPARVKEIAQALADSYLNASGDFSRSKAEYSYEFFRKQVDQLQDTLQRKAVKLREYETANAQDLVDILNLESGKANLEVGPRALLTEATRNKQRLEQELLATNVLVKSLEAGLKDREMPLLLPEMEVSGRAITSYRNKVAQLQLQINEMRTQYTEAFDPLKALVKELGMTVKLLRDEVRTYIDAKKLEASALQSRIDENDKQILRYEAKIAETAQQRSTYEALKQDYALANQAYSEARNKMEQARMASSVNQDVQNITIVEQPVEPLKPVKPNRVLIVLLGLVGGLFTGVAVALGVDYFDHTIKTPEDIERYLEVPAVGSISHIGV